MSFIKYPFKYLFKNSYSELKESTGNTGNSGNTGNTGNTGNFEHATERTERTERSEREYEEYYTAFFSENSTQTEEIREEVREEIRDDVREEETKDPQKIYVVVNNSECICAYSSEEEAKKHVENLSSFLMCTDTYKMLNGNAIFIYKGIKLQYKISYSSILLKPFYSMLN